MTSSLPGVRAAVEGDPHPTPRTSSGKALASFGEVSVELRKG